MLEFDMLMYYNGTVRVGCRMVEFVGDALRAS